MTLSTLHVPTPDETLSISTGDGEAIALRFHANPGKPVLALSHGNGFAIDAYAPFWAPLRARFALCLFDVRHHGWNAPQDPVLTGIDRYADDFDRIYRTIRERTNGTQLIGVFHSLSAMVALYHAANHANPPDAFVLFDPPIQPPSAHPLAELARGFELKFADWAETRTARFDSSDELAARYARSRFNANWVEGAYALMARSVLRQTGDGDWVLRCPPAAEAQNYRDNAALISWALFERIEQPIALICGDPNHEAGQSPARVCAALAQEARVDYVPITGTTHMLQIERPDACAAAVQAFVESWPDRLHRPNMHVECK